MALHYFNNKRFSVDIVATSNSGNIVIAGNNSVSNIAIGDDVVESAAITHIVCASPSGNSAYWQVLRGANTVITPDSTAVLPLEDTPINLFESANLVLNLVRAADNEGSIMVRLKKKLSTDSSNY